MLLHTINALVSPLRGVTAGEGSRFARSSVPMMTRRNACDWSDRLVGEHLG